MLARGHDYRRHVQRREGLPSGVHYRASGAAAGAADAAPPRHGTAFGTERVPARCPASRRRCAGRIGRAIQSGRALACGMWSEASAAFKIGRCASAGVAARCPRAMRRASWSRPSASWQPAHRPTAPRARAGRWRPPTPCSATSSGGIAGAGRAWQSDRLLGLARAWLPAVDPGVGNAPGLGRPLAPRAASARDRAGRAGPPRPALRLPRKYCGSKGLTV